MAIQLIFTLALVFLNGFFVAAEFAIVKVRASQLELKAKKGSRPAMMARHIVTHLDGYLAATQLGITLASLGLGWIGEPVVSKMIISVMESFNVPVSEDMAHKIALPIAFAIITVMHIVFGELAPKSIAIQRSEGTTLVLSYPLHFFFVVFRPFIWILNGIANVLLKMIGVTPVHGSEVHSSDEMKYLVTQSKESGTIEKSQYDLLIRAFEFSDRKVRQILIPRTNVTAIDAGDDQEVQLEKIVEGGYSRYPVFEESIDRIIGIAHTKDVLLKIRKHEEFLLKEIMRKPLFIPESMHIGQLLTEFQRKRQQMAVIVDEYGNTQGIITMEDIIEELVGDIQDEYDEEQSLVHVKDDSTFIVQAQGHLININERLPVPLEIHPDYTTLAGAVIHELTHIPGVGEKLRLGAYEVTVLSRKENSILQVQLKLIQQDEI